MSDVLSAPFFEIGPKNLLRRDALERVASAAAHAGSDHGVAVVLTVPPALLAVISRLEPRALVFAQGMDADPPEDAMGSVSPESLIDAGAAGVMLNHDARPLSEPEIARSVARAAAVGLQTIVCAATEEEAVRFAALGPTAVLLEPPTLIGTAGAGPRPWISTATRAVHAARPGVLAMHAGGIASPRVAEAVMGSGADGTGSTSGVLNAHDPGRAARAFIAATRSGWEHARRETSTSRSR